ncbi:MAG: hypothetical protein ACI4EV_04980 [Lachnospiraceae bacterium]
MVQNIFVGVICVIILAAAILGWWVDRGGSFEEADKDNIEEYKKDDNKEE